MAHNPYSKFKEHQTFNKNNLPVKKDERILKYLEENKECLVLDVGAGNSSINHSQVIQIDLIPCENTTIACDAEKLPFKSSTFDAAYCSHVLEHVKNPFGVGEEIKRVLKRGGYVDATVPFICPYHDTPDNYFNMTSSGIKILFNDFEPIDWGVEAGAGHAVRHVIGDYKRLLKRVYRDKNTPFLEKLRVRLVYRLLSWGIKFNLEKINLTPDEDNILASAVYFRGRKK